MSGSVPEVNIGIIGHVDHGKTTLVERLSGKWTDTHSEEMKRGITIRLGYADATFYQCSECDEYTPHEECDCGGEADLLRSVSFVDAPGHESLMATMLAGATIMDGAILLVAANEPCPQPQTREHLKALEISGVENVVVVQNKIDLVDKERAMRNYEQIQAFLDDTEYADAPVIPVSAQHGVNISELIEAIEEYIPTPEFDDQADPRMLVARSFDINKPGASYDELLGGVLGGAVTQGKFSTGDEIELRPGQVVEEHNQLVAKPMTTTITGLETGNQSVDEITPGGSVGMMTKLDPAVTAADSLVGNLVGEPDTLPDVLYELTLETNLLDTVVGFKDDVDVDPVTMDETLMLNVNSAATVGVVTDLSKGQFTCKLKKPIAAEPGSRVTISRKIGARFRLIGWGKIVDQD